MKLLGWLAQRLAAQSRELQRAVEAARNDNVPVEDERVIVQAEFICYAYVLCGAFANFVVVTVAAWAVGAGPNALAAIGGVLTCLIVPVLGLNRVWDKLAAKKPRGAGVMALLFRFGFLWGTTSAPLPVGYAIAGGVWYGRHRHG